ncbi:MAG: 16S rRNA (guanine(966)-N(2))-methyltransferase RsmD [bacterium]|nr:16S rRNA (guanine(966)-N(2))-methyltransferase RsmD [bacterium]
MKVISGIYKGRNITGYNITGTRPTLERVKESLFATIQDYIPQSQVLDLFSGSGNLAIESLSEGAKMAYAVDNNKIATDTIKKNINNIGVKNCQVILADYKIALKNLASQNIKFDIIFLDPPYARDYIEKSINYIEKYDLLASDGIIVCESQYLDKIIYSASFTAIKEKKYGDKWVVILKKIC